MIYDMSLKFIKITIANVGNKYTVTVNDCGQMYNVAIATAVVVRAHISWVLFIATCTGHVYIYGHVWNMMDMDNVTLYTLYMHRVYIKHIYIHCTYYTYIVRDGW